MRPITKNEIKDVQMMLNLIHDYKRDNHLELCVMDNESGIYVLSEHYDWNDGYNWDKDNNHMTLGKEYGAVHCTLWNQTNCRFGIFTGEDWCMKEQERDEFFWNSNSSSAPSYVVPQKPYKMKADAPREVLGLMTNLNNYLLSHDLALIYFTCDSTLTLIPSGIKVVPMVGTWCIADAEKQAEMSKGEIYFNSGITHEMQSPFYDYLGDEPCFVMK